MHRLREKQAGLQGDMGSYICWGEGAVRPADGFGGGRLTAFLNQVYIPWLLLDEVVNKIVYDAAYVA